MSEQDMDVKVQERLKLCAAEVAAVMSKYGCIFDIEMRLTSRGATPLLHMIPKEQAQPLSPGIPQPLNVGKPAAKWETAKPAGVPPSLGDE